MNGIKRAYKYFNWIKLLGVWISGISLFGMMVFIAMDVLFRNVGGGSINGGFEIVAELFHATPCISITWVCLLI